MNTERHIALFEDDYYAVKQLKTAFADAGYTVSYEAITVAAAIALLPKIIESPVLAILIDRTYPDGRQENGGDKIAAAYTLEMQKRGLQIPLVGIGSYADVRGVDINFAKSDVQGILGYLSNLR